MVLGLGLQGVIIWMQIQTQKLNVANEAKIGESVAKTNEVHDKVTALAVTLARMNDKPIEKPAESIVIGPSIRPAE